MILIIGSSGSIVNPNSKAGEEAGGESEEQEVTKEEQEERLIHLFTVSMTPINGWWGIDKKKNKEEGETIKSFYY